MIGQHICVCRKALCKHYTAILSFCFNYCTSKSWLFCVQATWIVLRFIWLRESESTSIYKSDTLVKIKIVKWPKLCGWRYHRHCRGVSLLKGMVLYPWQIFGQTVEAGTEWRPHWEQTHSEMCTAAGGDYLYIVLWTMKCLVKNESFATAWPWVDSLASVRELLMFSERVNRAWDQNSQTSGFRENKGCCRANNQSKYCKKALVWLKEHAM